MKRDTVDWLWSLLKDVSFLREVDKTNLILYLNTALDIGAHLQRWILKNLQENEFFNISLKLQEWWHIYWEVINKSWVVLTCKFSENTLYDMIIF